MYEFAALYLGSGRRLAAWRLSAVLVIAVSRRACRPLTPFCGELDVELVQRPLLLFGREHLPGARLLLRGRLRTRGRVPDDFEHDPAVAGELVQGRFEDRAAGGLIVR